MHWYHTLEQLELSTPSRNDGIDFETEYRYRTEGVGFIMELGNKLGLRYLTMATGSVYFHRFYMFHSFREFSRWVVGTACLFLAGKVEETPKKCGDILKVTQKTVTDNQFQSFGENPREEVMICERVLLQTIRFDLQVDHPYQYLIKYGKRLKGNRDKINELVQKAWIFINDSLATPLCLLYKPQVVALGVLLMAVRLSNQDIRDLMHQPKVDWWDVFFPGATEADLEHICKELLEMYDGHIPKRRYELADKGQLSSPASSDPKCGASPKSESPTAIESPAPKRLKILTPTSTAANLGSKMEGSASSASAVPGHLSNIAGTVASNSGAMQVSVTGSSSSSALLELPVSLPNQVASASLTVSTTAMQVHNPQSVLHSNMELLNSNVVSMGMPLPDRGFPVLSNTSVANSYYQSAQMNGYGYMPSGQQMMHSYNFGQQPMQYPPQQSMFSMPPPGSHFSTYGGGMMPPQPGYNMYGSGHQH